MSWTLRVNAVKELADLSRLGDGGAAVGCDVTAEPGPGRSKLAGGVRTEVMGR
jgi:hypothetical protein